MFPMFVDVSERRIVVFGGGDVAKRKVQQILESGGRNIEVYSLDFADELREKCEKGEVKCIKCDLWHADIDEIISGAFLVIICTDDDVLNERIYAVASSASPKVLVNYGEKGDVFMSSVVRKGGFVIAISTTGGSPAMAHRMKQKIASAIDEKDAKMLTIQSWLRERLKQTVHDEKRRREILNHVLNSHECWNALNNDIESAKSLISNFVNNLIRRYENEHEKREQKRNNKR